MQNLFYGHADEKLQLLGNILDVTDVIKSLGAHVSIEKYVPDLALGRLAEATAVADRIRFALLPFDVRFKLMSTLVLPKGLYECTVAPLSGRELQKLQNAVLRGIVWGKRGRLCADIVFTLFGAGHQGDLRQAIPYLVLTRLHRMTHRTTYSTCSA